MNTEENSDTKSEEQVPNETTALLQKKKRSPSLGDGSPKRKKHKTEKHKKKKRESSSESVSSDTDSSVSTSSSSTKEKRKKRKKKKHKKEKKKKVKREREKDKRKRKKEKKKKRRQSKEKEIIGPVLPDDAVSTSPSTDISQTKCRSMAPMTKEEWEKKQSIVRRVFDEETGRYRLIKGDGEVLEEIVSKERHREINRQATVGDGAFFQAKLATLQPK